MDNPNEIEEQINSLQWNVILFTIVAIICTIASTIIALYIDVKIKRKKLYGNVVVVRKIINWKGLGIVFVLLAGSSISTFYCETVLKGRITELEKKLQLVEVKKYQKELDLKLKNNLTRIEELGTKTEQIQKFANIIYYPLRPMKLKIDISAIYHRDSLQRVFHLINNKNFSSTIDNSTIEKLPFEDQLKYFYFGYDLGFHKDNSNFYNRYYSQITASGGGTVSSIIKSIIVHSDFKPDSVMLQVSSEIPYNIFYRKESGVFSLIDLEGWIFKISLMPSNGYWNFDGIKYIGIKTGFDDVERMKFLPTGKDNTFEIRINSENLNPDNMG